MRTNARKLIAPILITVILAGYLLGFSVLWTRLSLPLAVMIPGVGIPLALIGVSIFVLVERIQEVRSGEEDDLSKY